MRKKIGQQFIIGIEGKKLTQKEIDFIIEYNIGGVILFARNLEEPKQIHALVSEIQNLRFKMPDKAPLFVSVDMEGGRVHRLKDPFTQWPALNNLGKIDSTNATFEFGLKMGEELKAFGFNLDYAPCADVLLNPKNQVIGDRAFGTDPELVAKHVSAITRGYMKANVMPCGKHFPGHGSTLVDSHEDLPVDNRNLKQLEDSGELEPFKRMVRSRINFIMTAHMKFPNIDKQWPVTLSPFFLKQILRQALRYRGLIISDDLGMKAIANHYDPAVAPVQALNAGVNVLLYCNDLEAPQKAIQNISRALSDGKLTEQTIMDNFDLIMKTKEKFLTEPVEPFSIEKAMAVIQNPETKEFAKQLVKK